MFPETCVACNGYNNNNVIMLSCDCISLLSILELVLKHFSSMEFSHHMIPHISGPERCIYPHNNILWSLLTKHAAFGKGADLMFQYSVAQQMSFSAFTWIVWVFFGYPRTMLVERVCARAHTVINWISDRFMRIQNTQTRFQVLHSRYMLLHLKKKKSLNFEPSEKDSSATD